MKRKATSPISQTDWKRVDQMTDEQIDFSDLPEVLPEKLAQAIVRRGLKPVSRKTPITRRIGR
jgi:hypothetical protein